jgi:Na+-transporting NADH:ubiquinone oxidoreductase subunit A
MNTGRYLIDRVVGIGGPGIVQEKRGFFKCRQGYPIDSLIAGRNKHGFVRMISGDLLTGEKVDNGDFLHFNHTQFCALPENGEREFLHFFRLGMNKFSVHKAYLSGHLNLSSKTYEFTTNQHGEERFFIDGSIYQKVMPMQIPVMHLIKALMAEDFEKAERLGLLEVDSEDFALPTFICPSKIEMTEIVKMALYKYAAEAV